MAVRFSQGEILFLLQKMGLNPLRKGGTIYGGIGPDGVFRTCKFDYHKDRDIVASGTTRSIATSLGFCSVQDMKDYIDNKGWKRHE